MLEWSDDDEDQLVLPPSTKEASADAEALKQAREGYVRAMTEIPATQTTRVPEQQEGTTAEPHTEGGAPGAEKSSSPLERRRGPPIELTRQPRPGDQAGIADSRKSIGRRNHKYVCLGVIILFLDFSWLLTSQHYAEQLRGL